MSNTFPGLSLAGVLAVQVIEFPEFTNFPAVGATNRIYIDDATGLPYRWKNSTLSYSALASPPQVISDADGSTKGIVRLTGALGGTAAAPVALGYASAAALATDLSTISSAAAAAQSTANTANSAAGTAQTAANAAQSTANAAGTAAAAAQSTANSATTSLGNKADKTTTVNGQPLSANVTLTKADVGLGSADNTPDASKPISGPVQAALDGKFNGTDISGFGRSLVQLNAWSEVKAGGDIPDKTNPSTTGIFTHPGAWIAAGTAITGTAINPAVGMNTASVAADTTFTFASTPGNGQEFAFAITNTDTNPHVMTIPSSVPDGQSLSITTLTVPASSTCTLTWRRDGSVNRLYGAAGVGTHMVPVMAAGITPSATAGCAALASVSMGAGMPDVRTLDFDAATQEHAEFAVAMPESWDEGTLLAEFLWSHASGTGDVIWGLQGVAVSDNDTMAVVFGTAQEATDTALGANKSCRSPRTSAITIGGTPAAGDTVFFRVYRKAAAAGDTLTVDARLHGVRLYYNTNADTDA